MNQKLPQDMKKRNEHRQTRAYPYSQVLPSRWKMKIRSDLSQIRHFNISKKYHQQFLASQDCMVLQSQGAMYL